MGDVLGAIFGTSSATTQTTTPDPVQQQANRERLAQILALFQGQGLYNFADTAPGAYTPTPLSAELSGIAGARLATPSLIPGYSNIMSMQDYTNQFSGVDATYVDAINRAAGVTEAGYIDNINNFRNLYGATEQNVSDALARNYGDYTLGAGGQTDIYNYSRQALASDYNAAIARGDYDYARQLSVQQQLADRALTANAGNFATGINIGRDTADRAIGLNELNFQRGFGMNEAGLQRSLGVASGDAALDLAIQEANRQRALQMGIGATGNYVDLIATPRINQAMTLQGLERGGAVPAAIARAVAEQAMPYLSGIETSFAGNQANTLDQLMALRGQLTGNNTALNAAMLNNLMGLQTGIGTNLMGNEAALAQAYLGLQSGVNTDLAAQIAAAGQANAASNAALGGQQLQAGTALAGNYQNNVQQLAQAMMVNGVTLEQAGISAQSALGQQLIAAQTALRQQQSQAQSSLANTYMPARAGFVQSLPAASAQLAMLPGQLQAQDARTLTGLMPLADFPRQLQEADLLRRQGLFTTTFTGIPWQAGSTTFGGTATGNIFDQLGGTIQSGLKGGGNIGGAT